MRHTTPAPLKYILAAFVASLLALVSPDVPAQAYPTKPITWIVPFPPGGVTDSTSRVVAKRMSEILGVSIVVENKPGAGGMLGVETGARAAPDGYTIMYVS